MKIEIKKVDTERNIVQITTSDERWYQINDKFLPSVTWICGYYPKGIGFMKWLAEHGWDESEAIKMEAANKGSKVHQAISDLLMGKEVKIDAKYMNHEKNVEEELTTQEYEAVMSFSSWLTETNPEVLKVDYTLVNEKDGYAGTIDMKLNIKGETWIVDIKTSQDVYPSHELQVSAYKKADPSVQKIAILQVGYRRNKSKYKFTEIEDQYPLFLAAKAIWAKETEGVSPLQKDYPISLQWKREPFPSVGETKEIVHTLTKPLKEELKRRKVKVVRRKKVVKK